MANQFKASQDVKDKIKVFQEADATFRAEWEAFELQNASQLEKLEKLRDDRNAKLDEAKRSLRAEADTIDVMRTTFTEGPFKVQKKWSDFFIPEKLVALLTDRGLYDSALSAKIVQIVVSTAKFAEVKQFLENNGVLKDFECCEDGKEDSTAISGPKQVPPFGAELKKE